MASGKEEQIYQMFDRIAPTYDAVNRVLSFGQDRVWRQKLCDAVPKEGALSVLDVATGTADLLLALCQKRRVRFDVFGERCNEACMGGSDKRC